MKNSKKKESGKASIRNMIRLVQTCEFGFNEIPPKALSRTAENTKKVKKKIKKKK